LPSDGRFTPLTQNIVLRFRIKVLLISVEALEHSKHTKTRNISEEKTEEQKRKKKSHPTSSVRQLMSCLDLALEPYRVQSKWRFFYRKTTRFDVEFKYLRF